MFFEKCSLHIMVNFIDNIIYQYAFQSFIYETNHLLNGAILKMFVWNCRVEVSRARKEGGICFFKLEV